jgi:hypothetical protein
MPVIPVNKVVDKKKIIGKRGDEEQICQMAYFQAKIPSLGIFWRVLQWKMFVYFVVIWSTLRPFGKYLDRLVYFLAIWFIFPVLVCCAEKNLATLLTRRRGTRGGGTKKRS